MAFDPGHVKVAFIDPAMAALELSSPSASMLLLGTAAIESGFTYVRQLGGGPAVGLFQMERPTFDYLCKGFLVTKRRHDLRRRLLEIAGGYEPDYFDMVTNHKLAAALARLRYYVSPHPIPVTVEEQAFYWCRVYNGVSPHDLKPKDYMERWQRYGLSDYSGTLQVTNNDVERVEAMPLPPVEPVDLRLWAI